MCGGTNIGDFAKARLPGAGGGWKSWVTPGVSADVSQLKKDLELSGVKKVKPPTIDPAVERAAAEAQATTQANSRIAMQRKAMRDNSLLTGGGLAPQGTGGRSTLGV